MRSLWQQWSRIWGLLFYAILVVGITSVLLGQGVDAAAPIGLAAATFAVWYTLFGDRWSLWTRGRSWAVLYFAGSVSLWLLLVVVEPVFVFAGVGLFAHVCLLERPWSVAAASAFGAGFIVAELALARPFQPVVLISAAFATALFLVLDGLVRDLRRYAQEQRSLVRDLEAAQAVLGDAEREAGRAAERQRLAREIHDTMAQGFTSVVMLLEAADAALPDDMARAREHIKLARDTSRQNLSEARSIVWALRSPRLAGTTLPDAIEGVVSEFSRLSGIETEFELRGRPVDCSPDVEEGLLRVTQESLTNISKHAQARHARVSLVYEGDGLRLDVRDDGVGFEPGEPADGGDGGLGLRGIAERVSALGGTQTLESEPGLGSTLAVWIPTTFGQAPPVTTTS